MSEIWTIRVPVLSTGHLPSKNSVTECGETYAAYEFGWFVWIPSDPDGKSWPAWITDVRAWMDKNDFTNEQWVRFDSVADEVEGLKTYEW